MLRHAVVPAATQDSAMNFIRKEILDFMKARGGVERLRGCTRIAVFEKQADGRASYQFH